MNSGSQVQTTIAVRLVTAAALPANTYSNGLGTVSTGAAATITADANGVWTVDGSDLVTDDVIGVKDESDAFANGVYVVSRAGTASTKTLLTRHPLANNAAQFAGMLLVSGPEGADNASTVFAYSGAANPVLGTDDIAFTTAQATHGTADPVVHVNVNDDLVNIGPDTAYSTPYLIHVFNPAGTLASLRFSLDVPYVADKQVTTGGQILSFTFTQDITAITWLGDNQISANGLAAPDSATAGDNFKLVWSAEDSEWIRFE